MGSRTSSRDKIGSISYPKPVEAKQVQSSRAVYSSAQPRPSLASDQSEKSLPMVTQKPPEDPFVTTDMEIAQEIAPPSPPRGKPVPQRAYPKPASKPTTDSARSPHYSGDISTRARTAALSAAGLGAAAGAKGLGQHHEIQPAQPQQIVRMKSQFDKSSNPWRGKVIPSVALPPRIKSYDSDDFGGFDFTSKNRESVTSAYTRRQTQGTTRTARSEQFDLMISPTLPHDGAMEKAIEAKEQRKQLEQQKKREETPAESSSPNWKPYEGT